VPNTIRSLHDDLVRIDVPDWQDDGPDLLGQLRLLLAEQSQHLDRLRGSIARIGQALSQVDSEAQGDDATRQVPLLKAQAEAIQGLTLLAIKGQRLQAETIAALDVLTDLPPPRSTPTWLYSLVGASVVLSLLAFLF
jgi:hypothetical protein